MPIGIEVGLIRLPRRLLEQRRLLQERDANLVRAGLDRHADLEVLIRGGMKRLALGRLDREHLHARPVQQQLDIVRIGQPLDVLIAIPGQANLDLVLAVEREGVGKHGAAAGANRKPLEMTLLREVGGHPDRFTAGRSARTADREPADLLGSRDIAIEQRRRQVADRHVVEAVAGIVGRQERAHVDVERQEIADRVVILGSGEPPDRRRPARIRAGGGRSIERGLQVADHGVVGRIVRAFLADGRHLAGPQLANHLLPDVRMADHVAGSNHIERETAFLVVLVVTRQAVFVDEGEEAGGRGQGMGSRLARVEREAQAASHHQAQDGERNRRPAEGTQTHIDAMIRVTLLSVESPTKPGHPILN